MPANLWTSTRFGARRNTRIRCERRDAHGRCIYSRSCPLMQDLLPLYSAEAFIWITPCSVELVSTPACAQAPLCNPARGVRTPCDSRRDANDRH